MIAAGWFKGGINNRRERSLVFVQVDSRRTLRPLLQRRKLNRGCRADCAKCRGCAETCAPAACAWSTCGSARVMGSRKGPPGVLAGATGQNGTLVHILHLCACLEPICTSACAASVLMPPACVFAPSTCILSLPTAFYMLLDFFSFFSCTCMSVHVPHGTFLREYAPFCSV